MSFWYGLSFEEVAKMPMAGIEAYLERLPARMAEWKMMMADPIALPHLKKKDQQAMTNSWARSMRSAQPAQKTSPGRLQLMGIGVRFVE